MTDLTNAIKRDKDKKINKWTKEWVIQGNYGCGWEDENYETNILDATRSIKEYRENMPQYPHRRILRRVKNPLWSE